MASQYPPLTYINPVPKAPVRLSLDGHTLIFTHIPKAAGTTLDHILTGIGLATGQTWRRANGTLYNQFLGPGKPEALDTFKSLSRETLQEVRILTGHLPFGIHRGLIERPIYTTVLREPVARYTSHYRFGIQRGGWTEDTRVATLIGSGAMVDNAQVRQLSGCIDPREACNGGMLKAALRNLEESYALVGVSERFNDYLASLAELFGWTDIMYGHFQKSTVKPAASRMDGFKQDLEPYVEYDRQLYDAVKARVDQGAPGAIASLQEQADRRGDFFKRPLLLVSPITARQGNRYPVVRPGDIPALLDKLSVHGVQVDAFIPAANATAPRVKFAGHSA